MAQSAWSLIETVVVGSASVPSIGTPPTLPSAIVNEPYLLTFSATGPGTFTWEVQAGSSLPAGLTLNPSVGSLSGVPTTTTGSPFSFYIRVRNSNGWSTAVQFTLAVNAVSGIIPGTIAIDALPTGQVGVPYSYEVPVAGTPVVNVTTSALPSGWTYTGGILSRASPVALSAYPITFTPNSNGGTGGGTPKTLYLTIVAAAALAEYRHITEMGGASVFSPRRRR